MKNIKYKLAAGFLALSSVALRAETVDFHLINANLSKISNELVAGHDKIKSLQVSFDPKFNDIENAKFKIDLKSGLFLTPWSAESNQSISATGKMMLKLVTDDGYLGSAALGLAVKSDVTAMVSYAAKKFLTEETPADGLDTQLIQEIIHAQNFDQLAKGIVKVVELAFSQDQETKVTTVLTTDSMTQEAISLKIKISDFSLMKDQLKIRTEIHLTATQAKFDVSVSSPQLITATNAEEFKTFLRNLLLGVQNEDEQVLETIKDFAQSYLDAAIGLIWGS